MTLTALTRWVSWRFHPDGVKFKKVPKNCKTGRNARVTDPACWSPFGLARAKLGLRKRNRPDGLGFVFAAVDGQAGVDLDRCRDPVTGVVEPWAMTIVRRLDTYAEVFPSGTGSGSSSGANCLRTGGGRATLRCTTAAGSSP